MFEVTFLGHQGWLLRTATTAILIDPLLTERFGHGGLLGSVFPPRRIDLPAFPSIDAVILSHEHDDHFDIPSLHRLERSIPIYLSARASGAAREILGAMGASVHPLQADQTLEIGDLRYHTVCADHRDGRHGDEWDVFPFLAYDTAGHGSLLSSIDVGMPERMLETMGRLVPRPGLWAYANNTTNTRFQDASGPAHALPEDGELLARVAVRRRARIEHHWGSVAATLICGGGWSFGEDRAWLDRHAFPLDPQRIRAALLDDDASSTALVPTPGATMVMKEGRLIDRRPSEPFLQALPPERWPSRDHAGDGARLGDYAPACGRRALEPSEHQQLRDALGDFARYLYGRDVFRQLCSLPTSASEGRVAGLGVVLRDEDRPTALRYDPTRCAFVEHEGRDPMAEWMSGLECWGSDLLALLRGEIGPTALCYAGRLRVWNADPRRLRISPHALWTFAHPLRRPAAAAALYRRLWSAEPDAVPRIRGRA